MKIIFFILAAMVAIALAAPAPEAETEADPQYHLSEDFMDSYGELDAYPDADPSWNWGCLRRPWLPGCRRLRPIGGK